MKRNLLVMALILALIVAFASFSFAEVKNSETIIEMDIGSPATIDPSWCYDTTSAEIVYNIYESLIGYKDSSLSEFVPMLSTEVPSVKNGLISEDGLTYTFPIREGVKFHNGDVLTPEDVEYTFKRHLVFDRSGGGMTALFEPLCGTRDIEEIATKVVKTENYSDIFEGNDPRGELKPDYTEAMSKVVTDYVDKVVSVDGNKVVFHLKQPCSSFLTILASRGYWGSIMDKKWAIDNGAWDGKANRKWYWSLCLKKMGPRRGSNAGKI